MLDYVLGITFGFVGFFVVVYYLVDTATKLTKEQTPDFIKEGRYLIFIEYDDTENGIITYISDATTMADLKKELEVPGMRKAYIVELKQLLELHNGHLIHAGQVPK